mgnify:CR=1 FL=1
MPKVLISDKLSPAAVQIFRDRGIEVDFKPKGPEERKAETQDEKKILIVEDDVFMAGLLERKFKQGKFKIIKNENIGCWQ